MDDFFNYDVAEWIYDRVSKMDDAEAEMFTRFFTYEVHKQDLDNNRRLINRHVEEVSKSLLDAYEKISKADDGTPYFDLHGVEQPRDDAGRWTTINAGFKITRRKPPKYGHELKGETLRQKLKNADEIDVTGALNQAGRATSAFAENWTASGKRDPYTNERTYRRVAAGAQLLGAVPDKRFQAAAAAGQFAGQFGPEAEKVIGPAARRTAYRYRGTERNPDEKLIEYEDMALQAELNRTGKSTKDMTPEIRMSTSEAAAVAYLAQRLPSKKLADLHRQSGKLPPSEGVIISADGNIVTQAVGYNEDHYLPFNLKNLKGLQGGAYVRTRSSGGLTTEDIYTGLISGARSITVVSRSGIFTLDFEDDLRGGRRYSDKARQMVGRYAQTLDAVQSEQVARRKLDPDERAEIRDEVEEETRGMGYKTPEIEEKIREREREYTSAPRLTSSELERINRDAQVATDTWKPIRPGSPSADRVRTTMEKVPTDPKKRFSYYKSELMDAAMEEKAARMYRLDAEGYKAAMDALEEQFPYFVQRVDYKPLDKTRPPSREKDVGYVRPNYNRPKAVRAGYFDEDINGAGKFAASQLHYQNLRVSRNGSSAAAGESSEAVVGNGVKAKRVSTGEIRAQVQMEARRSAAITNAADAARQFADKSEYPMLARYRETPDLNNFTAKDIDQLIEDLNKVEVALQQQTEDKYKPAARALTDAMDEFRRTDAQVKSRTNFKPEMWNPAVVSPYPQKWSDDPEHSPGHEPAVYQRAFKRVADAHQLGITPDMNDSALRAVQMKWSEVYDKGRLLSEAPADDVPEQQKRWIRFRMALVKAGMNDAQLEALENAFDKSGAKGLERDITVARDRALDVIQARSIVAASEGKLTAIAEEAQEKPIKGELVPTKGDPLDGVRKAIEVSNDDEVVRRGQEVLNAWSHGTKDQIFQAIEKLPNNMNHLREALLEKLEAEGDEFGD